MAGYSKNRRAKGEGSLQKLPGGKYKIQLTVGYDQTGRQIRRCFTGKTKSDAINMLNKFKAEQYTEPNVTGKTITFLTFSERWLLIKKMTTKAKSYTTYELAVKKHLQPAFGSIKLQKLTTAKINDYFAVKAKIGLSPATLRQHRAILHNIMELALAEKFIRSNSIVKAVPLPTQRREYNILTPAEAKKLLKVAREYQNTPAKRLNCVYHFLLLALATGMRRGELLALRRSSVDWVNNTLTVKDNLVEISGKPVLSSPKTANSCRIIAVESSIIKILYKDLWQPNDGPLFHTNNRSYIPFSTLGRIFRKLLKMAGIEKHVRLHDLRHTHVSHLLAEGFDLKMVARRIGDDARTALLIYAHALPDKDRSAAEYIGTSLLN